MPVRVRGRIGFRRCAFFLLPVIYLSEVGVKTTIFMMIYPCLVRSRDTPDGALAEVAIDKRLEMVSYLFVAPLTRQQRRSQFIP